MSDDESRAFVRGFVCGAGVAWLITNLVWQVLK